MTLTVSESTRTRYFALIPAAGVGSRMGADCPKQYLNLLGKPVLQYVIDAFVACGEIERIYVVVSQEDRWLEDFLTSYSQWDRGRVRFLCCGGKTRRDSVLNGLNAIFLECASKDWILVHDAARPGLNPELIRHLIKRVKDDAVGGLLALPVMDTVKKQSSDRVETVSREGLWLAQTPQMFQYATLQNALEAYIDVTDEASAIEALGLVPRLVQGHLCNSKITQPADLALVEMFLLANEKTIN